jgi:hypothetical protein
MNFDNVERIANSVLYEGFMRNPYRTSTASNRQRFNFGVLYPREYCEPQEGGDDWQLQMECLLAGNAATPVEFKIRFLHLALRPDGEEGVDRSVRAPACGLYALQARPLRQTFEFEGPGAPEARSATVQGEFELKAVELRRGLFKITLNIRNCTALTSGDKADREEVLLRSLVAVHSILGATGGKFISLIDPPVQIREAAESCNNFGAWPVLAGDEKGQDTVLAAPIILYDYPRIAAESGLVRTGIDGILTLRIRAMTNGEKLELRKG